MDLLKMVLNAAGSQGGALDEIATQAGVNRSDATSVLGQLVPALGRALQKNTQGAGGLESLIGALKSGNHQRYLDEPAALADSGAIQDGNGILGHLLGSKDASRNVAAHAASQTGVDAGLIKKMLPMVAALAMGALSKQTSSGEQLQGLTGAASAAGALGPLAGLLDSNNDGQVLDDIISLGRKLF